MEHNSNTTRAKLAKLIDDGSGAEGAVFIASRILAECVVIPRADLPEVVECEGALRVDGATYLANFATPAERRRRARHYLALAEYLDAREAREAKEAREAEQAAEARRDVLATELGVMAFPDDSEEFLRKYELLSPIAQVAVNWLMEAQDRLAKYEEAQA